MTGFGSRLAEAKALRGPLCVGIDPHPALLEAWGLPTTPDGLAAFCDTCVEAFAGFAVVKPQVAFLEAYGAAGYAVLERTIIALRAAGVLVLADAKRGDIGSTMAAYAAAWAGDSPLAADAVKLDGKEVEMADGSKFKITVNDKEVMIGNAKVMKADIKAKNGVIHVIDAVLMPTKKGDK